MNNKDFISTNKRNLRNAIISLVVFVGCLLISSIAYDSIRRSTTPTIGFVPAGAVIITFVNFIVNLSKYFSSLKAYRKVRKHQKELIRFMGRLSSEEMLEKANSLAVGVGLADFYAMEEIVYKQNRISVDDRLSIDERIFRVAKFYNIPTFQQFINLKPDIR